MIFDGDRDRIEPYLRELADLIGLRDWEIRLIDGVPDDETAFADVCAWTRLRRADIRIIEGWADAEPATFRRYLVHELVHCLIEPLEQSLRYLANAIGQVAFDLAYATYREAEEIATDSIAVAWARTLPLPVKAKTRKKVKA